MAGKKKDNLKYGEARERLEAILREIEGNEIDVDDLGKQVKEAAQLIQLCRRKLDKTRLEVEKVVAEMALAEEETAGDGASMISENLDE
ncbi:MAG: exodeoxyribonuclease VII small subunit, partial [Planctomycetes bacterium]|nr:exodeoxyribonuclease VII small subunit [Planctomycetota bacterium]